MATSGTITFTKTAGEIVDLALRRIGVIGEGDSANAAQYASAQADLNFMLRTWQLDGPRLWGRTDATLTLVSGTQTYTLSPRPMAAHTLRFAIDGTERYPLSQWGWEDWDVFPMKTTTGQPKIYVLDRQRAATSVKFWPVPVFSSEAWTVPYSYERVFEDITASSQDLDVPQEALELVTLSLAARQVEVYPAGDSKDAARQQRITARAVTLYNEFMGFNRQGEVRFVRGDRA